MSDNVFIFGAGFSCNAKIPLLSNFMDVMLEIYHKKKFGEHGLTESELKILSDAVEVRNSLDVFHGRSNYNDRNIEDILSILQFNKMAGDKNASKGIVIFNKAIKLTIDLTCSIREGDTNFGYFAHERNDVYEEFWKALEARARQGLENPIIISFNYDLVLERSLIRHFTDWSKGRISPSKRVDGLRIKYSDSADSVYEFEIREKSIVDKQGGGFFNVLEPSIGPISGRVFEITILKPHGSLNISRNRNKNRINDVQSFIKSVDDPLILPPVFNKMEDGYGEDVWKCSMRSLRQAKRLTVVGYSMPSSDIYMKYFLKSGLGPNALFSGVSVFDPVTFSENGGDSQMIARYQSCFSPQIQSRISFKPPQPTYEYPKAGKVEHLVALMNQDSKVVFF